MQAVRSAFGTSARLEHPRHKEPLLGKLRTVPGGHRWQKVLLGFGSCPAGHHVQEEAFSLKRRTDPTIQSMQAVLSGFGFFPPGQYIQAL